jgi:NTE family protein
MGELRAIDFVGRLLDQGILDAQRYKKMLIHLVHAAEDFRPLNASSKLNAEWNFLIHLHDIGRKTAKEWLDTHYEAIGKTSTVDIRSLIH